MTNQEVIERQDNIIKQLENIIIEAKKGPKRVGIVKAGPDSNNLYRISSGGTDIIIVADQGLSIPLNSNVMFNEHFIERILPDTLMIKEPPVDFKHILWNEIGGMSSQIEKIKEAVEDPITY